MQNTYFAITNANPPQTHFLPIFICYLLKDWKYIASDFDAFIISPAAFCQMLHCSVKNSKEVPKTCFNHKETPWSFLKCIWNTEQFNYLLHTYSQMVNRWLISLILFSYSGQNNLLYSSRLTPLDYMDIIAVWSWKRPCNFNLPSKYTHSTNYKQASSKILSEVFYWLNCGKMQTQVPNFRLPYRQKC